MRGRGYLGSAIQPIRFTLLSEPKTRNPRREPRRKNIEGLGVFTFMAVLRVFASSRLHLHLYGSANATYASPACRLGPGGCGWTASFPPPVAAMTTYCLPFASYVVGGAKPPNGRWADHSSSPVDLSNARIFRSRVPAQNTSPPAVASGPPKFSVPVPWMPRFVRSACSPSGTRQTILPVFKSIALSNPHGGLHPG